MPAGALTGSRIRERRTMLGLKQSVLARTVGISAAYLNLIEHNKRRIAGKLLTDIARALEVDPAVLADRAEASLVAGLRDAAAVTPDAGAEEGRAEEFAGRFPGWAALVAAQRRRIAHLERVVEGLSDRMTHDPHLAASLHELLSTVTAINSTASILVEPGEIAPEWRDRFHRNIHEDSQRLAETSQALVNYLDATGEQAQPVGAPQEELEAWLEARDYHLREMERLLPATPAAMVQEAPELTTTAGRALAEEWLARYRADAEALPLASFEPAAREAGYDPGPLAARFGVGMGTVLRRLAALPPPEGAGRLGLVVCDGSGTLTFRKPVDGFPLPRFGAACPLWPLYQALSRPLAPVRAAVEMAGRDPRRFMAYAVAEPMGVPGFDAPPVFEAVMLIVPGDRMRVPAEGALRVGTSCRICPRGDCTARREPSILAEVA
ncbi:short-chain fatty acyl-CoA regulator family protein [Psychromarinibacter sp. C21-152]|uniref:Short-chain fatty acyl-CoA regulator family protein n=1 Tax=Psychromarinibacter sediminicola TaxID=3033385 RepID=A0AAE3NNJ4_9RHOB|nr:helix-turn-helix transcriptional regulator [Psychromarinibacter sediminicola]MDF0599584.1 short-chain fatty acyl-CoA regulator family protein [Psychromarinibacter sediminicola]